MLNLRKCQLQAGQGALTLARMLRSPKCRLLCLMLDGNNLGGHTNVCGHVEHADTAANIRALASALEANPHVQTCTTAGNKLSKPLQ